MTNDEVILTVQILIAD